MEEENQRCTNPDKPFSKGSTRGTKMQMKKNYNFHRQDNSFFKFAGWF